MLNNDSSYACSLCSNYIANCLTCSSTTVCIKCKNSNVFTL